MAFAIPAGLSTLLTIGGTIAGIAGAVVSTSATISANNYQKEVARRNAELMNKNAERAGDAAQQAQIQQDQATAALLGEQIAAQSASGLKLGGRSQMLTRKSARELGRLDALTIRNEGDVNVFNYRMMAQDETDKIKFLSQANNYALLGGFLDAASIGLKGVQSLGTQGTTGLFGNQKKPFSANSYVRKNSGGFGSGGLKFAR